MCFLEAGMEYKLTEQWYAMLKNELSSQSMQSLKAFIDVELKSGKEILPSESDVFNAFHLTPFEDIKIVILGQDPYHGIGQAHGLSFSVQHSISKLPPSLVNIFKELDADLCVDNLSQRLGDLSKWARQGVLLLNSVLTVEANKAASHKNKGWELFTDRVIELISDRKSNVVFVLWGAYAQKKSKYINSTKHHIIKSAHPSPLSSYRGFFGSKPFSSANKYLKQTNQQEIDWKL